MKKITLILLIFSIILFSSCEDAGTLLQVDQGNNPNIEVYKYFYSDGVFIYVARFKDQPNVVTTTWQEGKNQTKSNVTIFENDSVKVILK
jgi:hypothetical protein